MSARRKHGRRRRRARPVWILVLIAAAAAVGMAVLSSGSGHARRPPASPAAALHAGSRAPASSASTTRKTPRPSARVPTAAPSPGSLPQTHAYPSASSARFKSLMASLWAGVVQDSLTTALPAFFPRGAYVQLKAIASAGSDWRDRLVRDYGLDVAAAHALLDPDPSSARLLAVNVPSSYGHWVPPGVCYNEIGYYEVPNARVVYSESGQVRSFGIASMISWRGVWYVVHLGAILRTGESGMVDEPSSGSGVSAYSGTC
jgi:hypothetical protein